MGKHQVQTNLEGQQIFTTAFSGFESPEGITFGFGTTVGNGVEGWSPSALFIDTNASAGARLFINDGTKTTAAFKAVTTIQSPMIAIADGAAYTVLAANSGKVHLVLNQGQDATLTLPTAAEGLYYEFVSTMEAADGHDWIIDTGSDTNFFKGGLLFIDSDIAGSTSEVILSAGDGNSNSKLQINLPSVSTSVKMYCDGTNWFIWGTVFSVTAPAFSDQ